MGPLIFLSPGTPLKFENGVRIHLEHSGRLTNPLVQVKVQHMNTIL